jgi:hypothetical protein
MTMTAMSNERKKVTKRKGKKLRVRVHKTLFPSTSSDVCFSEANTVRNTQSERERERESKSRVLAQIPPKCYALITIRNETLYNERVVSCGKKQATSE